MSPSEIKHTHHTENLDSEFNTLFSRYPHISMWETIALSTAQLRSPRRSEDAWLVVMQGVLARYHLNVVQYRCGPVLSAARLFVSAPAADAKRSFLNFNFRSMWVEPRERRPSTIVPHCWLFVWREWPEPRCFGKALASSQAPLLHVIVLRQGLDHGAALSRPSQAPDRAVDKIAV